MKQIDIECSIANCVGIIQALSAVLLTADNEAEQLGAALFIAAATGLAAFDINAVELTGGEVPELMSELLACCERAAAKIKAESN